jgi:RND family efflux transporter MFP subunit
VLAKLLWVGAASALASCGSVGEPQREAPLPIRVSRVVGGEVVRSVTVSGTVSQRLETALGFTSSGRIASIRVQEGDSVRKGQLLAAMDATPIDADVASARAERVRADAELARSITLLEKGWVTQPRVDNARAAAQSAAASLRSARFASDTARIHAPSSGIVLSRLAEPAQIVALGTPVLVLGEDSGGFVLRVPLTDRDMSQIRVGAPAQVILQGLGGAVLSGKVIELGGRAQSNTGSFVAEIALPADVRLRSGLIGSATIRSSDVATQVSLVVPPAALFAARAGEAFVYVVGADQKARLRKVRIAETQDTGTRVINGVAAGEWVAVSGIDRLSDGLSVAPARPAR